MPVISLYPKKTNIGLTGLTGLDKTEEVEFSPKKETGLAPDDHRYLAFYLK